MQTENKVDKDKALRLMEVQRKMADIYSKTQSLTSGHKRAYPRYMERYSE